MVGPAHEIIGELPTRDKSPSEVINHYDYNSLDAIQINVRGPSGWKKQIKQIT